MRKEIEVGDHMKNDFRDFYDEEYIMHKAYENSTEEELMHGEWSSNIRKYIDKVRTRTGKWKYIYPEDLKKKAENVKRDVSYKARNLVSKVTGKNKTFENKVRIPQRGDYHYEGVTKYLKPDGKKIKVKYNKYGAAEVPSGGVAFVNTKRGIANDYAREQKKGGVGMSKYAERRQKEIEKEKQHNKVKAFNTNIKRAKEEVRNRQDKIKSQGLKPASYHVRTDGLGYKRQKRKVRSKKLSYRYSG